MDNKIKILYYKINFLIHGRTQMKLARTTTSLSRRYEMTKQYGAYKHKFRSRSTVVVLL